MEVQVQRYRDLYEKILKKIMNPQNDKPLVSIITLSLNSEKYLEQTIKSVIRQTYKNIEYIIIDGGSKDGSVDIIKKYEKNISYWVSEPDKGIVDAFNKGIHATTGDIIGILNSGDWYEPNAIELVVSAFKANPDSGVVHGDLLVWEADGSEAVMKSKPLKNKSLFSMKTPYKHPTMFVRKKAYDMVGLFNTAYKIAMDYDLMLRLIFAGVNSYYVEEVLTNMRLGGISYLDMSEKYKEAKEIIITHGCSKTKAHMIMIYRMAERRMWHFLNILGSHKVYMLYRKLRKI